jgi:hypothetical protein
VPTIDIDTFRTECQRRLIDTYSLALGLGLRSRQAIWARVEKGDLPEPIIKQDSAVSLWDRDAIPQLNGKK